LVTNESRAEVSQGVPYAEPVVEIAGAFVLAGVLWLVASHLNIDVAGAPVVPWTKASNISVEWTVVGLLWLVAGVTGLRSLTVAAAIGASTTLLAVIDVIVTLGPFKGHLTFTSGVDLTAAAFIIAIAASGWLLVLSHPLRSLTRQGLITALVFAVPALIWAVAYGPSWLTYNYSVVGGKFTATGTNHLIQTSGNIFSSGVFSEVLGIALCITPLVLIGWASLWRRSSERLAVVAVCGLFIASVAGDNFWDTGTITRSQLPKWWGWAHQGHISYVATAWLWASLCAGLALCLGSLVAASWARANSNEVTLT
jgi:hypothetical protein